MVPLQHHNLTLLRSEVRDSRTWWLCRCVCGTEKWIRDYAIKHCVSCGCVNRARKASGFRTTHGMRRSPEYGVWCRMNSRCYREAATQFKWYGARGIAVFEEWRHSFEAFFAYVGKRPSARHSLDRFPNNNGNYEPGNVRWATPDQQARNKRTSLLIEFRGQKLSLLDVASILGITYKAAHHRLTRGTLI